MTGLRPRPSIGGVPQLNTARGAIDTADLGVTLMHEHVFMLTPEIADNYPEVWGDEAKREADAIDRLNELKSRGVDSIVDLTVIGLGRYIPRIARIAAATDINIVVATGVYTYNDVPMYFSPARSGNAARRPGDHDRDVRRRHHRRHRRHRHQGRNPQVRHRRTGCHPWCRAGAAGRRAGAPPNRRADLDAHPCRHPAGSGAAADLRRRGRRPVPCRDRALRRHHRHRLPGRGDRQRVLHRHGPLRAGHVPEHPRNG